MAADQKLVDRLKREFGQRIVGASLDVIDPWIEVSSDGFCAVAVFLRDDPGQRYDMLNCISGVDYLHVDPRKAAKATWQPHVELVYHLSSTVLKHQLVLKILLPRWQDDREGELPEVPSVSQIWRTADWHEREVYDLMGIRFTGHADLRRILCPEDWVGHPLRKDYKPPEYYHGIRN